jgi:hypothetical protein
MASPTGALFYDPRPKPLAPNGTFQPGAYYLFFATGTTTPQNVFADGLLTTPLSQTPGASQPSCTADSTGRFNPIYMDPTVIYRVQLFSALNVLQEDTDPYLPGPSLANLVTNASLASTLTAYETTASLAATLTGYLTTAAAALLAPLNSPPFTGIPTAPTAAPGTNTTQLATTAFVTANTLVTRSGTFTCSNGVTTVTFGTPFANTAGAVFVQWNYSAPDVGNIVPGSLTLTGFQYQNGNAGACYYFAIGT